MCDLVWYCHSVRWTTTIMREMKKKVHTHASLIQKESNVHTHTPYEFDFVIWTPFNYFIFHIVGRHHRCIPSLSLSRMVKKIAQNERQNKTETVTLNVILGKAEVKWKDRTKTDNNCESKEEACHFQFFKFSFPFLGHCCALYLITMIGLLICIVPFFAVVFFLEEKKRHRFFSINFNVLK